MNKLAIFAALAALTLCLRPALADETDAKTSAKPTLTIPTALAQGDRIRLKGNLYDLKNAQVNKDVSHRAGQETCFRITKIDNGTLTLSVDKDDSWFTKLTRDCKAVVAAATGTKSTTDQKPVADGEIYTIAVDKLEQVDHNRYGWVYGPMYVPYKYFPHDKSFEPSQSLGMYLGYRFSSFNRGVSLVGSAGAATMKVSSVVDSLDKDGKVVVKDGLPVKETKENTVAGYSIAAGLLFDLTREAKPFVAGLVVGRDFVGKNSALTYKHDRKTWIALQLGWNN